MMKIRLKAETEAGKRELFGNVVQVKAKPAKTVIKAFPVAAIKAAVKALEDKAAAERVEFWQGRRQEWQVQGPWVDGLNDSLVLS